MVELRAHQVAGHEERHLGATEHGNERVVGVGQRLAEIEQLPLQQEAGDELQGALAAENKVGIKMNVPKEKLQAVIAMIPSLTARENVALVTELVQQPMAPEEALALVVEAILNCSGYGGAALPSFPPRNRAGGKDRPRAVAARRGVRQKPARGAA